MLLRLTLTLLLLFRQTLLFFNQRQIKHLSSHNHFSEVPDHHNRDPIHHRTTSKPHQCTSNRATIMANTSKTFLTTIKETRSSHNGIKTTTTRQTNTLATLSLLEAATKRNKTTREDISSSTSLSNCYNRITSLLPNK